jgi:glutathione synthase/RimK-type ligase-like ATP-grasp enzyme
MKKPFIFPYKMGSGSAGRLAKRLDTKKVYPDGKYNPRINHVVVNWGCSQPPNWATRAKERNVRLLNSLTAIHVASDKALSFEAFEKAGVKIPDVTKDQTKAVRWMEKGNDVIARTVLRGSGGIGCHFLSGEKGAVHPISVGHHSIKLYTLYIKKTAEYRVHVFNGKVIDVVEKRKIKDRDDVDYKIRNHDNGWVFAREGVDMPKAVGQESIKAINALGLDFGAVDVIWNRHHGAFVLEVNTAPGLEGTTIESYATAIEEYCRNA